MGETVDFWLTVSHLGRSSLRFTMGVSHGGTDRVRMNRIVVCVSQASGKPVALPDELRGRINEFMLG
jgi:acyl-CoA thioesterase FadM